MFKLDVTVNAESYEEMQVALEHLLATHQCFLYPIGDVGADISEQDIGWSYKASWRRTHERKSLGYDRN